MSVPIVLDERPQYNLRLIMYNIKKINKIRTKTFWLSIQEY